MFRQIMSLLLSLDPIET
uniref:Uncharacterized protein n=1 Tax=Arundo donax TaxID=35708 RepID=A0A0A9AHR7_ARUDO